MREEVLAGMAALVPERPDGYVRVGIDGVDGAGKTMFADALATYLGASGRSCVRVRADDFLQARAVRYRLGRDSPEGFFRNSYDLRRLYDDVLEPFGPTGSGRYRDRARDPASDTALDPPWEQASRGTALVLDGMFLHRGELVVVWDVSVFLDVPFTVTARRMAVRDGSDPDPDHPSLHRYVEGQRLYLRTCAPRERADVVVDNTDPAHPVVMAE